MRKHFLLAALLSIWTLTGVSLAEPEDTPEACQHDSDGQTDYQACFDAAAPGSPIWMLTAINLGSEAFWNYDFETAAHYYDLSAPAGSQTISDVILHANRASVFLKVGRLEDSLRDARLAWGMVQEGRFDLFGNPLPDDAKLYALEYIVQTFNDAAAPELDSAVRAYLETPIQTEVDLANKAAVLTEIGRYDEALTLSTELVASMPEDLGVLNNHCYLLTLMGRSEEGLPFCRKAVALGPKFAALQHSLAVALAGAGECEEADTTLAKAHALEPSVVIYSEPMTCKKAASTTSQ